MYFGRKVKYKICKICLKIGIQNFKTQYNYIKIQHSQQLVKFTLAFHLVELNRKTFLKKKKISYQYSP